MLKSTLQLSHRKVESTSLSCLEAHVRFLRLFIHGKEDTFKTDQEAWPLPERIYNPIRGHPYTMSSQGGRGGGVKNCQFYLVKRRLRGGQKLPILRRHSLWTAPKHT